MRIAHCMGNETRISGSCSPSGSDKKAHMNTGPLQLRLGTGECLCSWDKVIREIESHVEVFFDAAEEARAGAGADSDSEVVAVCASEDP